MDDSSKKFVATNTHKGLYCYNRLPFGIASAPAIFQKTMETVLQGIPYSMVYIDNILVTGANDQDHLRNLDEVLQRLQQWGAQVYLGKCAFMQESVENLGYPIDAEGVHPTGSKLEAIIGAPVPQNISSYVPFWYY